MTLTEALAAAEAALAERERLETIGREVATGRDPAQARVAAAQGEYDDVTADLALDDNPAARERLKAAKREKEPADAALARLASLQRALPAKLADADRRIAQAASALAAASQPAREEALERFTAELKAAVDVL